MPEHHLLDVEGDFWAVVGMPESLEGPCRDRRNTPPKTDAPILGLPSRGGTFRQHSKRWCHWQRGRSLKDPGQAMPGFEVDGEYSAITAAQCRDAQRRVWLTWSVVKSLTTPKIGASLRRHVTCSLRIHSHPTSPESPSNFVLGRWWNLRVLYL